MMEKCVKWSKRALFLVCIGFFMPIACNGNGVSMTKFLWGQDMKFHAVCMTLTVIVAVVSILYSLFHRNDAEEESLVADGILLGIDIFSGVCVFRQIYEAFGEFTDLQLGAYMMMFGWGLSLIFLCMAFGEKLAPKKKRRIQTDEEHTEYKEGSKHILLLVCFGYFLPILGDKNGIGLVKEFWHEGAKISAVCMAMVLVAAAVALIYWLMYRDKADASLVVDRIFLGAGIFGGLCAFCRIYVILQADAVLMHRMLQFQCENGCRLPNFVQTVPTLRIGAYMVIAGWGLSALLLHCASRAEKE